MNAKLEKDLLVIGPHAAHWPKDAPYFLDYPATPLTHNLLVSAQRYPNKICLRFYGKQLTYAQTWQQVQALAQWLVAQGLVRGDRVLLAFQNSPQFVIAYFGILLAGGMVVPVNPGSKRAEFEHYLGDSGAELAVVAQDCVEELVAAGTIKPLRKVVVSAYSDMYEPMATSLSESAIPTFVTNPREPSTWPSNAVSWQDATTDNTDHGQMPNLGPDDLAVLPYTSGSTAKPKGCIHTHATVNAAVSIGLWWKALTPMAVVLSTAPFFHVTGMIGSMNAPLAAGATLVMLPRWDAGVAAALIETYGCTHWTNVPPMVVDVLSNPSAQGRDLSSLRAISGGGAAMPAAIATRLKEQYGLDYMEGYGMSEFMAATHINPAQNPKKQCLGIPVFDSAAHVIDPDTLKPLGANQVGEIVMSGPNMMLGYWGLEAKGEDRYAENLITINGRQFFRSGDLGFRDDDGFYFITDRLKRMINASGFKIWPAEVEGYFYKHEAIKECCVIGVPDSKRGETARLVAVLKTGYERDAEGLIGWGRTQMASYKAPTEVHFVDALPRTSTGKIFWRQLTEEARAQGSS